MLRYICYDQDQSVWSISSPPLKENPHQTTNSAELYFILQARHIMRHDPRSGAVCFQTYFGPVTLSLRHMTELQLTFGKVGGHIWVRHLMMKSQSCRQGGDLCESYERSLCDASTLTLTDAHLLLNPVTGLPECVCQQSGLQWGTEGGTDT